MIASYENTNDRYKKFRIISGFKRFVNSLCFKKLFKRYISLIIVCFKIRLEFEWKKHDLSALEGISQMSSTSQ
jgi:hypothetical protein